MICLVTSYSEIESFAKAEMLWHSFILGSEVVSEMREFSASILEPFGLRAKRVTRAYGAFICDTNQGVKLVKTVTEPEEVLLFAHGVKEHLARQGFAGTDRYQLSQNGTICEESGGERYTVRSWLHAEEAELTNEDCAVHMACLLGRMHQAAGEYETPVQNSGNNRCYEWPQKIYKSNRKLQTYSKMLRKNGRYTEFDLMVLECLPSHIEQALAAQEFFLGKEYTQLAERADRKRAFGHGRYTEHTVLIGRGQSLITDFEQSCYMIPVIDMALLLERAMRKNEWREQIGVKMLEGYDRWCPMGREEKHMVYALMLYPRRLYELCSEAYHMKRSWMPISYNRKLEELLRQQKKRKEFLKRLEHILR